MTQNDENIFEALCVLAECIDQLENVPQEVRNRKEFRTRKELIKHILRKGINE